jgi:hypothetical protein
MNHSLPTLKKSGTFYLTLLSPMNECKIVACCECKYTLLYSGLTGRKVALLNSNTNRIEVLSLH